MVEETETTVVMVTHDVNESVYLSDRVIVMSANKGGSLKIYIDLPGPVRKAALKTMFTTDRCAPGFPGRRK